MLNKLHVNSVELILFWSKREQKSFKLVLIY